MRRISWLIPALLGACAATPAPAPTGSDTGAVAISILLMTPHGDERYYATSVVFARIGEDGDALHATEFVTADVSRSNVVYALDLAPGRYAPVAALESRNGHHHTTYLPAELIDGAIVDVAPGTATSLGRATVRMLPFTTAPDEAQVHYGRRLGPNWRRASAAQRLFHAKLFHNGTKARHLRDEGGVAKKVRGYLEPSGWVVQ